MYNRAELIGRLTKNPEVKYTQSGKAVCSFSLATNEGYGEKQTTEYINVVTWEKEKVKTCPVERERKK